MKQSHGCRERTGDGSCLPANLNADGFGIGWYSPARHSSPNHSTSSADDSDADGSESTPGLYTSTQPAWSDLNLLRLAEKVASRLIFGHVRAASSGSGVQPLNCHPFTHGMWMFMHNGDLGGWGRLRRAVLLRLSDDALSSIKGTTDSEHLFALFLSEVERVSSLLGLSSMGRLPPEVIQHCIVRTIQLIEGWRVELGIADRSLLNICVTDGRTVVATRVVCGPGCAPSLYFCSGSRWAATSGGADFCMQQADRREHAVIVASERLTGSHDDWLAVPQQHMVVIHPTLSVRLLSIDVTPPTPASSAAEFSLISGATTVAAAAPAAATFVVPAAPLEVSQRLSR